MNQSPEIIPQIPLQYPLRVKYYNKKHLEIRKILTKLRINDH